MGGTRTKERVLLKDFLRRDVGVERMKVELRGGLRQLQDDMEGLDKAGD